MKSLKYILPMSLMLAAGGTFAADEMEGEKLYTSKGCVSCHGAEGMKPITDTYPKLGGQSAGYTLLKLKSYKAGEIGGSQAALMAPMASMLSDDEMSAVANYLADIGEEEKKEE